jgi:hypothetical protein
MVTVFMGKQDGIQAIHPGTEHLLPEIRSRVNHNPLPVFLDQDR